MNKDIYSAPKSELGESRKESLKALTIMRWIILAPTIVLSWLILFMFGGTFVLESGSLVPGSGVFLFWILGALSAITVMWIGFWVAPQKKYLVVKIVYILGVIISLIIIINSIPMDLKGPFLHSALSAITSGGLNFVFIRRKSHITKSKTAAFASRTKNAPPVL